MNRTKIVCTLGPASADYKTIKEMVLSGMNVARLNMSHGTHESHHAIIENVKKVREDLGVPVAIMVDTKGPEIRIKQFAEGKVMLKQNAKFVLTTHSIVGDETAVAVSYAKLPAIVNKGDRLLLNDGLIELVVLDKNATDVLTKVTVGGILSNNKSINLPGISYEMPYLSENDKKDITFAVQENADILSISFVNNADNVQDIRKLLKKLGDTNMLVCSKIESEQGVQNMDSIIDASDGVMVARGDLGVEIDFARIPYIQKEIIKKCNEKGKFTITATQMLESMVHSNRPTRAEISDVANAIIDGSSSVMLSGETSSGDHPALVVKTMERIAHECEKTIKSELKMFETNNITKSLGYAAADLALSLHAKAIISVTKTGYSTSCITRFRPNCPVLAFTPIRKTYNQLSIYYGAIPLMDKEYTDTDDMLASARQIAKCQGLLKRGDLVIQVSGSPQSNCGANNIQVSEV